MTREAVLARTMVELADNLVDDFDVVELLSLLADRCVEVLDIAAAGIMLTTGNDDLRLMNSSDDMMHVVELFEIQSQEGPCLDCFHGRIPIVNQNLTTAGDRWPRFAPVAVQAGFLGADAIPMRLRGQVIGALNLFRTELGSLNDQDVAVAQAFADIATIAILQDRAPVHTREVNGLLDHALNSRVVIEQAKGAIAEHQQVSTDEAFTLLRRYARSHSRRLADVARDALAGTLDVSTLIH